jgi:SET domain-containing protein
MLLVSTFVGKSEIEGVGVFAAEPIASGTLLWRFDDEFDRLIPVEKYRSAEPLVKQLLDRYAYPSPDKPGFIVYETDNGRFMNHSGDPNSDFSDEGGARATRDIAAGEEITCNYGDFYGAFELLPHAVELQA